MRTAALLTLLPFLAGVATAAPSSAHRTPNPIRKSLSFGPSHSHASFEALELASIPEIGLSEAVEPQEVAKRFLVNKLGSSDGFYIRPDVSFMTLVKTQLMADLHRPIDGDHPRVRQTALERPRGV